MPPKYLEKSRNLANYGHHLKFYRVNNKAACRYMLICAPSKYATPNRPVALPRAAGFFVYACGWAKNFNHWVNVNLFQSAVVCVAVVVMCGCDQGQPTPPAPSANGNATSAVTAPDFAATKKDAESGDAEAQHNLGLWYYNGQGVPQDFAEAVKWTRLAADQGDVRAQYNLGGMYDNGEGVPQDDAEAVKWYRFAAVQSDTDAQYNLGGMYYNGQGVPKDLVEAYAWWVLAAASGDADAANNRSVVARELTPDQLSQGQKRAGELLKKIGSGKQPSQGEATAEPGT
jgi:hypothetical protein